MYQDLFITYKEECDAARERYRSGLATCFDDPESFEQRGLGIRNMKFVALTEGGNAAIYSFRRDNTRLIDGSFVDLYTLDAIANGQPPLLKGELRQINHSAEYLTISCHSPLSRSAQTEGCVAVESCFSPDLEWLYNSAARSRGYVPTMARRTLTAYGPRAPHVSSPVDLGFSPQSVQSVDEDNDVAAAISYCMNLKDVTLVQGPPGTGKTRLLAKIARALAENGYKVGLCSYTNTAVDNACLTMQQQGMSHISRCGSGTTLLNSSDVIRLSGRSFVSALSGENDNNVLAATAHRWINLIERDRYRLDVLLVDEAAQMPLHIGALLIMLAPCMMLFGDDRQLGPVFQVSRADSNRCSMFEHFRRFRSGRQKIPFLHKTWRLNKSICDAISTAYYESVDPELTIVPDEGAADRKLEMATTGDVILDCIINPMQSLTLVICGESNSITSSLIHANLICRIIQSLKNGGISDQQIGVATPYRRQLQSVKEVARRIGLQDIPIIDTIERMQGQERDIMIVSLPAAGRDFLNGPGTLDFILDERRMNVAISRARSKVILLLHHNLILAAQDCSRSSGMTFLRLISFFDRIELPESNRDIS